MILPRKIDRLLLPYVGIFNGVIAALFLEPRRSDSLSWVVPIIAVLITAFIFIQRQNRKMLPEEIFYFSTFSSVIALIGMLLAVFITEQINSVAVGLLLLLVSPFYVGFIWCNAYFGMKYLPDVLLAVRARLP